MTTPKARLLVAVIVLLAGVGAATTGAVADRSAADEPLQHPAIPTDGGVAAGAADAAAARTAGCSYPFSETDATGTEVTVEQAPERVVTLGPAAAQTMWEIGARESVVGLTQYTAYLEGAESRANVSGAGRSFVSVERVIAQNPDLVIAENVVGNDTVEQLRDAGLTVYKFRRAASLEFVYEKVELTGRLVGACDEADDTADWMREEIDTVERAVADEPRPKALYVFFGYTAGPGSYVHEIITTAGADNVAAETNITFRGGYAQINPEVVANSTVEWLILNSDGPQVPDSPAYRNTEAVRNNNTIVLNANYISQPAPRIVYPIRKLAKTFHPEAYAAANATPTETPTPTATETQPVTPEATPTPAVTPTPTDGSDANGPGFGFGTAVLALLTTAALLARGRR